jgi:AhpD family alkylhydroperoxidase
MRFTFKELDRSVYKALFAFEEYAADLPKGTRELMKIRASQINGCAYCIDLHVNRALEAGESVQRVTLVSAWREASIFSAEECILLAMTEEVTLISAGGLSDETYNRAIEVWGPARTTAAIMTIIAINNWNRMVIAGHMPLD